MSVRPPDANARREATQNAGNQPLASAAAKARAGGVAPLAGSSAYTLRVGASRTVSTAIPENSAARPAGLIVTASPAATSPRLASGSRET